MEVAWPLVGRRGELAAVEAVLAGEYGGVVFGGRPGVGKTRLLREAIELARRRGRSVELVAATRAAASIPLGAMSHLLPADARGVDRVGLLERIAARWRGRDLVLAVDDAHLLDDGSAALVHYLRAHGPAAVVATVRGGEQEPDAITALWKDGLVRRVEVPPLSDVDVDELVRHSLDGHVPVSVLAAVRRLAEGNPLQLRALVLDAVESGALRQVDGTWCWQGPPRDAWRLWELVESRLAGCDEPVRALVELVACAEPVPLSLVQQEKELLAAERAGLVELIRDGRRHFVRLAHPLYGEVIRTRLRPLRLREIHRTLAEALRATPGRRRDDVLRIATWQLEAGAPPDGSVLLAAAAQAMARYDLALAERLARAAVDAGLEQARPLLADVLLWRGRHHDGIALIPAGDTDPAGLDSRARLLYWGFARHDEARATLTGEATATHALILLSDGRCRPAIDVALPIAENRRESVATRLWAYTALVSGYGALGQTATALRYAEEARPLLGEIHIAGPYLTMAKGYALLFAGAFAEARTLAARGIQDAVEVGDHGLIAAWSGLAGVIEQTRGDLAAAVSALREAVAIEERQDPTGNLRLHLTILAGALAMSGSVGEAQEALRRADELATPVRLLFKPQAETNRAWVAAAAGELGRAAELAMGGAAIARESELPALEALVLHDAARHGAAARVRQRLEELASIVDGALVAAYAASAAALAAGDGSALARVAATFARLDAPLLAVEAMVAASRAYRDAGQTRQANAVTEQAGEYAARCPSARTPGLLMNTATAALTPREREIALLAARSISSPEIAARLGVSVRTVNNHLARVYDKLGTPGRAELAKLFALQQPRD